MDEGYIKFNCNWIRNNNISKERIIELNESRAIMYQRGLIGVYPDGIGFGNISIRYHENKFLISGSATGGLSSLDETHYSLVTEYNLNSNSLTCEGPIKASSESLTHALIYDCSRETNAVIHIHHLKLWQQLKNKVPTSNEEIPYGTPEMANEIKRLFDETNLSKDKIIVMGGHIEGIISFGNNLEEAGNTLLNWINHYGY
jgi:ribulose-5-phosphate 4-epimerase/fuculose-1-phosphate aldolase